MQNAPEAWAAGAYGLRRSRGVYQGAVGEASIGAVSGRRFQTRGDLHRKGKRKRNRKSATFGKRPDTKRAIVSVADGERIDIFSSPAG